MLSPTPIPAGWVRLGGVIGPGCPSSTRSYFPVAATFGQARIGEGNGSRPTSGSPTPEARSSRAVKDCTSNSLHFLPLGSSMNIHASITGSILTLKVLLVDSGSGNVGTDGAGWSTWFEWVEPTSVIVAAMTLVLLCVIAWGSNLIALPGNWFAVLLLAIYAWAGPQEGRAAIGYVAVISAFGCALVGEIIEFIAGALGAQRAGASKKSTLFAVIGSMVGAIFGALVGVPVPVIGSVLAAILFGGVGATLGAMYGEWTDGRSWRESWSIGHAAFWGRTFGTLGKVTAGLVIIVIASVGVLV